MRLEKWEGVHIDTVYNDIITKIAPKGKVLGVGDSAFPHAILNMQYFHDNPVEEGVAVNTNEKDLGHLNGFDVILCNGHDVCYEDNYFDFVYTVMMLSYTIACFLQD